MNGLLFFEKNTQSTVKDRNNDKSDASLQVDHLGDVHGTRSGARPPIREAITKNVYISPGSGSLDDDKNTRVRYVLLKRNVVPEK